jgi:C1A family cysteine protease
MTTYNFVPKRNRKYGWIPDRPDPRDRVFAAAKTRDELPESVTLRHLCSAVEDQGKLSSCVGNACAGLLEVLENKGATTFTKKLTPWEKFLCNVGVKKSGCTGTFTVGFMDVSRLFIYYNARARDGMERNDGGCSIRSALKELNAKGYCWEKEWPYDWGKVNTRPVSMCYASAKDHAITEYNSLFTVTDMMACLADGYPFVIGLSIYESFEGSKARITGVIKMPSPKESSLGGHAVLCIGYNKKTERFLMKNSWGAGWGDGGYFTIPFEYVAGYGMDAWTIRK